MKVVAFDVSCAHLDYSIEQTVKRCPNDSESIQKVLNEVGEPAIIAMESTGRYHNALARMARQRGAKVYVVNARRFAAFKKSEAVRGKTDRLDAELLELFVKEKQDRLRPYEVPRPEVETLRELVTRREAIVKGQTQILSSLEGVGSLGKVKDELKDALTKSLKQIDKQIARALKDIQASELLLQIPGVGPLVAAGLLSLLERYEFISADAFVAYLGLDPRPNDSGKKQGARYLSSEGDACVRRLLFAGALSGSRTSAWKPYYVKQKVKGYSGTECTLILARKMARTAWSVHRYKTPFEASRLDKQP